MNGSLNFIASSFGGAKVVIFIQNSKFKIQNSFIGGQKSTFFQ
jgi:hypothetical protein